MNQSRIAHRYARALFELARDTGKAELIGEGLSSVQEVLAEEETLRAALLTPVATRTTKGEILDALVAAMSLDPMLGNFLHVLLDARKLGALDAVVAAYGEMADAEAGRVRGEAVTRMPLNQPELEHLSKALSEALDKEVLLTSRVDPSVLGGVVVQVGNLVFDGSLKTQLRRMKETLIKG